MIEKKRHYRKCFHCGDYFSILRLNMFKARHVKPYTEDKTFYGCTPCVNKLKQNYIIIIEKAKYENN